MLEIFTTILSHTYFMFFKWIYNNKIKVFIWLLIGVFIVGVSSIILFLLIDIFKINTFIATLINGEITILVRYYLNRLLVFKFSEYKNKSLLNFHLLSLSAFILWFSVINILIINDFSYLYANIIGILASVVLNFYGNFFIIWKNKTIKHDR